MTSEGPKKVLSLFDSTCLIVGIIIGAGIYQMAPDIARGAGSSWGVIAIWRFRDGRILRADSHAGLGTF